MPSNCEDATHELLNTLFERCQENGQGEYDFSEFKKLFSHPQFELWMNTKGKNTEAIASEFFIPGETPENVANNDALSNIALDVLKMSELEFAYIEWIQSN